ncbi:hypothetical protein DFH06DRAFT_1330913 [Mycena polygramma]|nr:hypothetical protein DFH06DRAFT_1330913 [Mycena polygramma]
MFLPPSLVAGLLLMTVPVASQVASPSWRKPNITTSMADRISRAGAALDVAIDRLSTDGLFDTEASGTAGNLYSQMAQFDIYTNQTKYQNTLQQSLTTVQKSRANFTDPLQFGHAAARGYAAYKDPLFLQYAVQSWWYGNARTISQADLTAGKSAVKNFTLKAVCQDATMLGGTFWNNDPNERSVASISSGYFLVLSALLAEATSDPMYLQAANKSADFIHAHFYNVRNIVQPFMSASNDSTGCEVVSAVDPTNSGLMIEGLAILWSLTQDSVTQNRLVELLTAVIPNTAWQGDNGVVAINQNEGNMNLLQGLAATYTRNAVNSTLQQYVGDYIAVQFNAVADLATSGGNNIYGQSWNGPPSATFSGTNQTMALGALIGSLGITDASSSSASPSASSSNVPTPNSSPSKSATPLGAIVGGVVGGLALIGLIVALLCFRRRRRSAHRYSLPARAPQAQLEPFLDPSSDYITEPFTEQVSSQSVSTLPLSTLPHSRYAEKRRGQQPLPPLPTGAGSSEKHTRADSQPTVGTSAGGTSEHGQQHGDGNDPASLPTEQLVQLLNQRLQNRQWDAEETPPEYPHRDAQLTTNRQTHANAAAHGSIQNIHSLAAGIPTLAAEYRPFLLPAFYAMLDPTEIRTLLDRLDSSTNGDVEALRLRFTRTLLGLHGIANLALFKVIPPAALTDLWPRVWAWIQFLDIYQDYLPRPRLEWGMSSYDLYLKVFRVFQRNTEASELVHATPGVRVVVGRAWRLFVRVREGTCFDDVCDFLAHGIKDAGTANFDELVDGAGGSRADLASVIVSHMDRVLPNPTSTVTETTFRRLATIIFIVEDTLLADWDVALRAALVSKGIVKALTTTLLALCHSHLPLAPSVLKSFFSGLVKTLDDSPSHILNQSLRAGLLRLIFEFGSREDIEDIHPFISYLICGVLTKYAVYHSVLSQLDESVREVPFQYPQLSQLRKDWDQLVILVDERLQIAKQYRSGELAATRACDNMECGIIGDKHNFKRCRGCSVTYYCSVPCQTADWRQGGHREMCRTLFSRRIFDPIRAKDRSFMRAIMSHDYASLQEDVALNTIFGFLAHPGSTGLPYARFTHAAAKSHMTMGPLEELDPQFAYDVSRVASSGGCVQLHLMEFFVGRTKQTLRFHLRSSSELLAEKLKSIAESMPPIMSDANLPELSESYRPVVQLAFKEAAVQQTY